MPESPNVILQTISILNQRYGLDISINLVEDSQLLPRIDKRKMAIRYNYRLLPLFKLYQLGDADLVIKYYLTHKYMSYGIYEEAKLWLDRTFEKAKLIIEGIVNEVDKHKDLSSLNDGSSNEKDMTHKELQTFQLLFVILHEYSHGLFFVKEDTKKEYCNKIKDICLDLDNATQNFLKRTTFFWGVRPYLMERIGYGFVKRNLELVQQIVTDERKLEEFACDLHAWQILASIMHYGGYSLDEQFTVNTRIIESLYYLENYKVLDDCLSYKTDMTKAENIALFDSMRYSLLTNIVVLFLEGEKAGLGKSFDYNFSILRWTEREEFITNINSFLPMTKSLKKGGQIPNKEMSKSIYSQIDELDNYILNRLESSIGQ